MSFLLHRSLTTGLATTTGYRLFPVRVAALASALAADGALAGTPWSVAILRRGPGGAEFDLLHGGRPFARGWTCWDSASHDAMWRCESLRSHCAPADEPAAGPWLLTFQLPDGADLSRKDPPLRLEARQLLNEAAQALTGPDRALWTPPQR